MRLPIQPDEARFGRARGFAFSVLLHVAALAALAILPLLVPPEAPRPVFNSEIRPYAEHLVWYNLRTKLPEVRPAEAADVRPPRARRVFHQQIVAGRIERPRPPQLIRVPAPQIRLAAPLKLPNLLAAAPRRPVRPFAPPQVRPRLTGDRPLAVAPRIHDPAAPRALPLDLAAPRPRPLPFIPPVPRQSEPALTALPAAPAMVVAAPSATMPRIPRGFSAPPERKAKPAALAEPALDSGDAPAVMPTPAPSTLAIVGLAPIDTPTIPKPPGSHEAGFSAGPHPRPDGGAGAPAGAAAVVPDLMAHGGTRDASPTLMAALRPLTRESIVAEMLAGRAAAEPANAPSASTRRAPDPRFDGRAVFSMSIQMPNVTSFSGSWMVWFAERRPLAGAPAPSMQSPVALRKVDPKYYRDTIHERVEGTVRLFAVIRKDGQVDAIEILRGIDRRLDGSAAEALAKWKFEPAKRDGIPVDVDAVFEVPFRLTPLSEK